MMYLEGLLALIVAENRRCIIKKCLLIYYIDPNTSSNPQEIPIAPLHCHHLAQMLLGGTHWRGGSHTEGSIDPREALLRVGGAEQLLRDLGEMGFK